MHYFLPGTNSHNGNVDNAHESYLRTPPTSPPRRDSWGYQYYSLEHLAFRWDQIFNLDYAYDYADGAKPGAQLMETARASDRLLIDGEAAVGSSPENFFRVFFFRVDVEARCQFIDYGVEN